MTEPIETVRDHHAAIKKPETAKHPASADLQRGFIKDCGSVTGPVDEIVDLGSIH